VANNQRSIIVDQLKNSVSLADLAERLGLTPKRMGTDYKALCPFHSDKKPSMQLYEDGSRSHFHCYACGAHGDIFHLTQQVKELDFRGSVDWLAQEYRLAPLQSSRSASKFKTPIPTTIGFSQALEIYRQQSKRGDLENWLEKRQLSFVLIEKAQLALAEPNILSKTAESSGSRDMLGILEDAGLLRSNFPTRPDEKSSFLRFIYPYQDFFGARRRIVFPIYDVAGNLQGFAGRLYEDAATKDGPPKYLYTPKLPRAELLYRSEHAFKCVKANTLQAAQSRTLYLCEGLLDALRLESLGLPAVALLGAQASGKQIECLAKLNSELSGALRCAVFLDRDDAGRRGAAQTIDKLIVEGIESVFIWQGPQKSDNEIGKDPEEILRGVSEKQAKQLLNDWSQPAALALLSDSLRVSPDEILDDEKWGELSPGRRYWAISTLRKHQAFLQPQLKGEQRWQKDINDYLSLRKANIPSIKTQQEAEGDNQHLALAIDLAEAGARRGELPSDMAAWRRIKLASTAFYEAFKTRLRQDTGLPLESFDAVYVSRGFGKIEPRLKAMPCPEDLIVQQYLLNDLLHDEISPFVPAVRYYRSEGRTVTTCETKEGVPYEETLSFAYQIDVDVVQGRRPPSDQGMFRHYFECWQEFNASIKRQSVDMSQVHCLRLDLSRYYDNLRRVVVRDALRPPLRTLFDELEKNDLRWFGLFQPYADNRADRLVDWLCDQSFGYSYYRPDTGACKRGEEFKGIPQGPVLSAWLATIALFPLDAALRRALKRYNTDGKKKVAYARYVDDVVLLADSQELLSVLRAIAEEAANSLFVELRQKGDPTPPMRKDEFIRYLSEGRALPDYGPMEEFELFPIDIGDGETGWGLMHGEEEAPPRYAALHLLRDARLYTASSELLINQIYTALQAAELRPGELGKAARWLWYDAAKLENATVEEVWCNYWESWRKVAQNVSWALDAKQCPWDDPAFYAIEGLEKLLETAPKFSDYQLSVDEEIQRKERLNRLAHFACEATFFDAFKKSDISDMQPEFWGKGVNRLLRQFWQRAVSLRWKAYRLASKEKGQINGGLKLGELTDSLRASLARAWLTDAESCGNKPWAIAETIVDRSSKNSLGEAILLLHEAYVRLGVKNSYENNEDLLKEISVSVQMVKETYESSPFYDQEDRFVELLSYLPPSKQRTNHTEPSKKSKEAAHLALAVLAEITPRECLMPLLANRPALIGSTIDAIPLPPLPGVPMEQLLLVVTQQPNQHGPQKISLLKRIRRSAQALENANSPKLDLWAMHAKEEAEYITLAWEEETKFGEYIVESAKWTSKANLIHFSPPSFEIGANTLTWVADAYEALANLSHGVDKAIEYAPAWPYIAANHWPGEADAESLVIALITAPVERAQLGRHAFMRDGRRGLRPIPIPEDFAHLWRIGVALTDSLGLTDDIDCFSPIDNSHTNQDDLANYLLRTVLSKLRGWFIAQGRYPVMLTQDKEGLPNIIKRSLSLLRNYDGD